MKLRIISGEFKGRYIKAPDSDATRPMTDRVRETLFNILNNIIDLDGATALDIFSGSGAIGMECISRGAEYACFVEKNQRVKSNLDGNILSLGIENRTYVYNMDVIRFLETTEKNFDIIIADPPFFDFSIHRGVKVVMDRGLLNEGGLMVVERSVQTKKEDVSEFGKEPNKKIGDALIYFFYPESKIEDSDPENG
ncbi:MAG: 16S rRNA (guanine(966)-N(2))-methyltransferase RsmD [Ignavibacteriaceae bacterium]